MKNQVRKFLSNLNSNPSAFGAGKFSLGEDVYINNSMDFKDQIGFAALKSDDIMVDYNFDGDNLSPDDDDTLYAWLYDSAWISVDNFMANNGYEEVFDNDGSGGGLYYGVRVYRKA